MNALQPASDALGLVLVGEAHVEVGADAHLLSPHAVERKGATASNGTRHRDKKALRPS